jgi:exodeoxyribonuclease-5
LLDDLLIPFTRLLTAKLILIGDTRTASAGSFEFEPCIDADKLELNYNKDVIRLN